MPKFEIEVIHTVKYKKTVDAKDKWAAIDLANNLWIERKEDPVDEDVEVSVIEYEDEEIECQT